METFLTQKKRKAVTFSYDDGVTQDIRLIELLNKYNLKCTFNLNSELLGQPGTLIRENLRISHYKIHPQDVKYIYDGHEVAVHTLNHPNLTTVEDKEVIRQVECDRENLSQLVGYDVVGMAYPCGGVNNDDRVAGLIREHTGVRYCRTITETESFAMPENYYRLNPTAYHMQPHSRLLELAEAFVQSKPDAPQVFYLWGHSYEMDYTPDGWIKLEELFEVLANQPDIFYGTNAQVLL